MKLTARVFALFGLGSACLFVLLPTGSIAQALVFLGLAGTSGALVVRMVGGAPARPWRYLVTAVLVYVPTVSLWYLLPVAFGRRLPYPSVLDGAFLLSYGLFGMFLVSLVKLHASSDYGDAFDALVVAAGASVLFWEFVLVPALASTATLAATITSVTYCVLLLALFGLVVRLAGASIERGAPYWLLIGWIGMELAGDVWYAIASANGTFEYGHPAFLAWICAYTLLGLAALHPRTRALGAPATASRRFGSARVAALGLAAAAPLVGIAYEVQSGTARTVLGLVGITAVLMGLVLVRVNRLAVDLGEQRRIHRQLESLTHELEHQAFSDPVTGLGSRALFNDRLARALESTNEAGGAAVLLLDLDTFKAVNDGFGHDVGDEVLCEVARRLNLATRAGDAVARIGGDEFAIVMNDASVEDAVAVAERTRTSLSEPVVVRNRQFQTSASVGIAVARPGDEPASALRQADIAMYAAKAGVRGSYQVYEPALHAAVYERHRLEAELLGAVGRGELEIHYQPIFHIATMEPRGVEALVRWRHPTRGLVPPDQFIPIAESSGAIGAIGAWVLETATRQVSAWNAHRPEGLTVAVNLSPRELQEPDLVARVRKIIERVAIDPSKVTLEVTETALMHDVGEVIETLHRLKEVGVHLAIDDFGTGYSSLSFLRRLPVDIIKIDRCFVAGIAREPEEWALTAAIIRLANSLGRRTLAEGIELGEQVAHLRALNCELGQGFLFSRPVPSPELERTPGVFDPPRPWLETRTPLAVEGDRHVTR